MEDTTTYHEIDFLLPAQRFNINFCYVTQKGLPFVREYVLRLVHLAPMTTSQIATFFGFSRKEAEEAIQDLVNRDELNLTESARLTLTEKSASYFTEVGEVPRLSLLRDSGARLTFDLATFTCLGRDVAQEKWKAGVRLDVDDDNAARSELHVEKHFQRQFNQILHQGFLSKSLIDDEKDFPSVYTVNSVNKIRAVPLRLTVKFQFDTDGRSVEREDFEILNSSDYVHERITVELDRLARPANSMEIAKAMSQIGDSDTLKLFDSKSNAINLQFLDDLLRLESNNPKGRSTFLGPIYSHANWGLLQKKLAPALKSRIESKTDVGQGSFLWLAPSDPYWSKSIRLITALSDFVRKASTKEKSLYLPTIYFPVSGPDDFKAAKLWKQELDPYTDRAHALIEGFLGGNVEIMLLEGELVAVVYHMSIPGTYPVTLPLGFISDDQKVVAAVGQLVNAYIKGSSGLDRPNDCGLLSKFGNSARPRPK
ncbi:hypothetical protein [Cupriavidus taiwanensis]|uniref:Uncharacterized protein n=1 Tax=Cupriavidus taiwanensis (strain DSM 17343 / BCRC 17206 / CCUG 44338 / CIP 107171 / LMG 19424 / R1) TaxID=977880 RepID=B2AI58_CUPTR|nr:hypothetical protein [Cupriavidus taiwanensis]CAP63457.1 conserved hypothetical protein [Cupriavidus taiwanensis LMG 19424]